MRINPKKLEAICKGENGRFESSCFAEALKNHKDGYEDMVPVSFDLSLDERKIVFIERKEVEAYARIAEAVKAPEDALLRQIKPSMHNWILHNRAKMCERLRIALGLKQNKNAKEDGVTIIWETNTPDKVDYDVVIKYLEYYDRGGQ